MKKKPSGYDHLSVLSTASNLSCRRTALKHCTSIEILWSRKLVSLAYLLLQIIIIIIINSFGCTVMHHVMLNSVDKRMCQEHQEKTQTKSTVKSRCWRWTGRDQSRAASITWDDVTTATSGKQRSYTRCSSVKFFDAESSCQLNSFIS